MPVDLKQQEEELRLLIRKIDSELANFKRLKDKVGVKRAKLEKSVSKAGLQPVPVEITPHSGEDANLEQGINKHLLDLNKLKNFINGRLKVVIREEELLAKLQSEYGEEVGIKKLSGGEFELTFADGETQAAFEDLQKSKKLISIVKKSVQTLSEEKE